ncbi:hypothetical protein [Bacillus smithii]|uniref:hypothetical protein n=1 Tax=Bacillus smithii TaxID=1479 RepID=UPI002E20CB87|nr:hypothetical protein [Bacillus smithii]MED4929006.1 hypothetical protein [Bacillus smithii]
MEEQVGVQSLIKSFIEESQRKFSSEEVKKWYFFFDVIFTNLGEDRFPYGDVTEVIYEIEDEKIEIIQDNLTRVRECSIEQGCSNIVSSNFDRLEDHIHLAIAQRNFILKNINKLEKQLHEKSVELDKLTVDLEEAKKSIDSIKDIKTSIYAEFVTILGIFTAVVLGAFGSLQVISSVFKNIKDVPTGKLLVFSSLTSLGVVILLFLLMRWINRIVHLNNKNSNWDTSLRDNLVFTISIIILTYILALGFLLYPKEPKKIISNWYSHGWLGVSTLIILTLGTICSTIYCLSKLKKKV